MQSAEGPYEELLARIDAQCILSALEAQHYSAPAIISGARTIATYDEALIQDCKNPEIVSNPRGKIYRHPALHKPLLGHVSSCGVKAK